MTLEKAFSTLTDTRRKQGLRTSQSNILVMVVLSYSCGYFTYRKISSFCKAHSELLANELNLKHAVPSHVTIREVLTMVDQAELINVFNKWAEDFVGTSENELISGDGKSLRSTVTDEYDSAQDFQSIVSFFCQKTGMVRMVEAYKNKKESEIVIVEGMLKSLRDKNVTVVLDALHIQKKQLGQS